jgi:hypothetical protein
MDFISYLLFMFIGILVASFGGWMFHQWWFRKGESAEAKGFIEVAIAAIIAIFSASR